LGLLNKKNKKDSNIKKLLDKTGIMLKKIKKYASH